MAILNNDKHSIGDLFNNRNPFIIPKHQRAYSWTEEEVEAFCNDITDINREYFFGGVVSVYQHANNAPGRFYRVVDGQQRLATFTLLIALLRNAYEKVSQHAEDDTIKATARSLYQELNNNYLTYTDTRKRPPVLEYRLTMSKIDKDFFKELLNSRATPTRTISHQRIFNAWKLIDKTLIQPILTNNSISDAEKLDRLQDIKDKILENSVVIHIVCDDLEEAFQLFEVLNDRGKELAIGDYLRSTTLELLEGREEDQEQVSSCWDQVLGNSNAEKYIKAYLSSHVATIKNRNVHRQFQKKFFPMDGENDGQKLDVKNRVINLKDMYEVYESILEGNYPYSNPQANSWEKNRLSLLIKQLDHKLCIPFLLAIFECGSEEDFKNSIQLIEKFVFRYITVSGLRANRLSNIYKIQIQYMRQTQSFSIENFKRELANILESYCGEQVFIEGLERTFIYKNDTNSRKKIRYFLTTIEDYYGWYHDSKRIEIPKPNMSIQYNLDNIEIEHIYPQNASNEKIELESVKHNIGNLTFWSPYDNKVASNSSFNEKKPFYKNSNIAFNRLLEEYDEWNLETLQRRTELYKDIANKVFSL